MFLYSPSHVVTPGRVEKILELDTEQKIFRLYVIILSTKLKQRLLLQTILCIIVGIIISSLSNEHLLSSEPIARVPLHHIALHQVGRDTDVMISFLPADQTGTPRRSR